MFDLTPFRKMSDELFEQMARSFNEVFDSKSGFSPLTTGFNTFRTDIIEKEDAYYVEAELPGFTKDDITIELEDSRLTIRAKRDEEAEARDTDNNYIRRERRYGEFVRQFYIDNVREDAITAKLEDGVLRLTLPKLEPSKPTRRQIDIE